jgi:YVTN family beta-propeller protein
LVAGITAALTFVGAAAAQPFAPRDSSGPFVNWESPHVNPLAITPDGQRLLAVNTADNRLEIFSITSGVPVRAGSVPVGLDPVTVRVRSNDEAWVVNHISDSVSVVNLTTMNVVATLKTADEPCDVAFALSGPSARAFVSCAAANKVLVFDPANLSDVPTTINIEGERPRAMAVDATGTRVYVAIFESGNHSTILGGGGSSNIAFPPNVVSNVTGPYAGVNPPPNFGAVFNPPIAAQNRAPNPSPPAVGLIVKKFGADQWLDDNAHNWANWVSGPQANLSGRPVGWDLYDHDVAVINASTLGVTYATGLMNICMNLAVNPASGQITVVGTDATNEVRFEPVVKGRFLRVQFAAVDPNTLAGTVTDLNPHLSYASATIPQVDRDRSIGDPRAVAWSSSGALGFVAGMGSNNVVFINAAGARPPSADVVNVGQGPTGLAVDEAHSALYVLNRFDATISVVDTIVHSVTATVPMFDPTPVVIKVGRKHLYDTHKNSGLGHIACASCHVDSRFDRLAWDLGDPAGAPIAVNTTTRNLGQNLFGLSPGTANPAFAPYHPMKGPMTTQSLQDIIGKEPHHWRGDRKGIEEFNPAFMGLQGDDTMLTDGEMQEFEDYLATITYPPNPYRNSDNSLPTNVPLPGHYTTGRFSPAGDPLPNGNAASGLVAYRSVTARLDMGAFACVTCHTLPTGAGTDMKMTGPTSPPYVAIAAGPKGERHLSVVSTDGVSNITMKIPQTRNEYLKQGFNLTQTRNTAGFGVLHDGSVDSIERFVSEPVFNVTSDQMVADLTAFMLAFSGSDLPAGSTTNPFEPPGPPSRDTHAAVGVQSTAGATVDASQINTMTTLAATGKVGVVAKGIFGGRPRGFAYMGGTWKSDRVGETYTTTQLTSAAAAGSEITFTVVPVGSETRIGIDRDEDGYFDQNELDVCSDPASAASRPGTQQSVDFNGDLSVGIQDLFDFLAGYFTGAADFNADGLTSVQDIFDYLAAWFACGA